MEKNYIHTNHPGYEANSAACEHATFPNWKINTSHRFLLFTWTEIMSFSVCRQMGVELLRHHTYTVSLISTHSRTHTIGPQLLCLGREISNILLSSSLWQSQQLGAKLHSNEVRSWRRRENQWITSKAICLQGNRCIIILQDKGHTCIHNSMCTSQTSILILKGERKYLKISNCTGQPFTLLL